MTIALAVLAATSAQAMAVPVAQLAPAKLAFADAVGDGASDAQTVTLTNTGDGTLPVGSVTIDQPGSNPPGKFTIVGPNDCNGANLANGQSCTVAVTYAASGPAPRAARLVLGADSVLLTGNGLTASPPSLGFTAQRGTISATEVTAVTNRGDAALPIVIRLAGASEGRFAIDATTANACGTSLEPNATCQVGVKFLPEGDGLRDAVLRVESSDPENVSLDMEVPLSGIGTPGPDARLSPRQLSYATPAGTTSKVQEVRLTNAGSAPLGSIGVSLIGTNFTIALNTCGPTLAPLERCSVNLTFTPPAATGSFAATLRFTSDDPANPALDVSLTGTVQTAAGGKPTGSSNAPKPPAADSDKDGVRDTKDKCPNVAGSGGNGCPSRLKADILARWSVKAGRSKLLSLVVAAPIGSRIELRCSGKRKAACGFAKRTITRTTKQRTGLTRYFKGSRVLPPGVSIILRVMRARYTGAYERLETRVGKKPRVTTRCLSSRSATVKRCP